VPANRDEITTAKAGPREPKDLLPLISPIDPIIQEKLIHEAKTKLGMGKTKSGTMCKSSSKRN